jgi:multiple sugar transport system ATP-binding protein
MQVDRNLSFGLRLARKSKELIKSSVKNVSAKLEIEDFLERFPKELSGGQAQRVAVGRALIKQPLVFLFDEPLSNLDAKLRTQMRIEIKKIHQRVRSTIMYVTHDQVEAMTLGDRIVVMKDGNIEQEGTPMDLFQNPVNTFVAGFIGNPPMNLVPAAIGGSSQSRTLVFEGGLTLPVSADKFPRVTEGMKVVMGLRPEDIKVLNGKDTTDYPGDWILDGEVEVSEPLGSETSLHVDVKQTQLVARSEGRQTIKIGDRVRLGADLKQLHIFDNETGRAFT